MQIQQRPEPSGASHQKTQNCVAYGQAWLRVSTLTKLNFISLNAKRALLRMRDIK
ncbi:hypothetical protein PTET_a1204 [Pseudoalteromonas tetraodonis]|nr:hypothetical protein PTET_a1204 [Pseudoalteromonas tetraodonis]